MNGWGSRAALGSTVALALACAGIGGCTNARVDQKNGTGVDGGGMPLVSIKPLSPSNINVTDNLVVTTTQAADGYDVVVSAGNELPATKELYAQLELSDPSYTPAELKLPITDSGKSLGGAFPSGPSTVDVGLVPVKGSTAPVLQSGETLLTFKLNKSDATKVSSSNTDHTVTTRARNLDLAQNNGTWVLSWDYTNPGDTNQDGEVGVQDLQQIGQHFHETLKDDYSDPLRHVDADANGEINLSDISSIGSNLKDVLWAYNIEMSTTGNDPFNTVGQLLLDDASKGTANGDTIRFSYSFVGQYVPHAWYRVVPLVNKPDGGVIPGTPSESISEDGRQVGGISVATGQTRTITVSVANLPFPLTDMNGCRVVFPASYDYVPNSFNVGSVGGARDDIDGIWGSFADGILLGPDAWLKPVDLGDGTRAIDFNVTITPGHALAAPVGYGDLFNFQLKSTGSDPLSLRFDIGDPNGVKRTYYSEDQGGGNGGEHFFGNSIGFKVN